MPQMRFKEIEMSNVITYGTFDLFHAGQLRLLQRTVLREFPLYCPKCRRESVISARNFQIETVYQPDAKTQC